MLRTPLGKRPSASEAIELVMAFAAARSRGERAAMEKVREVLRKWRDGAVSESRRYGIEGIAADLGLSLAPPQADAGTGGKR